MKTSLTGSCACSASIEDRKCTPTKCDDCHGTFQSCEMKSWFRVQNLCPYCVLDYHYDALENGIL